MLNSVSGGPFGDIQFLGSRAWPCLALKGGPSLPKVRNGCTNLTEEVKEIAHACRGARRAFCRATATAL